MSIPTKQANADQVARPARCEDVFFPEEHNTAGNFIAGDGIHQDEGAQANDLMSKVQGRSAEVCDFHIFTETVARLQKPHDIRSDAVIPEQDVSDSADQHLPS